MVPRSRSYAFTVIALSSLAAAGVTVFLFGRTSSPLWGFLFVFSLLALSLSVGGLIVEHTFKRMPPAKRRIAGIVSLAAALALFTTAALIPSVPALAWFRPLWPLFLAMGIGYLRSMRWE